jgi:cell division protein FtsI (penicillin-binding protein 3)
MAPRRSFLGGVAFGLLLLSAASPAAPRATITDRNGVVLAQTTPVDSIYAEPKRIGDVSVAAAALVNAMRGTDLQALRLKLMSPKRFVWIARHVDPGAALAVMKLSLPGVGLRREYQRTYPQGALTSHVVGIADYDARQGMSGAERLFDGRLDGDSSPLALSVDVRAQAIVRDELLRAMATHGAKGAAGLVLDARSGEVMALVSLPDFTPADHETMVAAGYRNKLTDEVRELGGFFEIFTVAIALDDRRVTPATLLDVTRPMRLQSVVLRDDEPSRRPLSVVDAFARSSVIAAALLAQRYTPKDQLASLRRLGLLDPMTMDGHEMIAPPLYRSRSLRAIDRTAIGYGYGVALAPLQAAVVATGIVNHGQLMAPTLMRRDGDMAPGVRIVTERTSTEMRLLLRRVVRDGTGMSADVSGWDVGGKTGTAFRMVAGRYDKQRRTTWFFAGFPMNPEPRYTLLVMLDEPQGTAATQGRATSEWNAAPSAGRMISELAPLLGVVPTASTSHSL